MSAADPVGLLSRVPLFSELSRQELERISRVAVPRSFPTGVRVFHEGDRSDACYLVRSGDLRVTREHSDGRAIRSEEHTSELQSHVNLVCRLLLEKKKKT